VKITYYRDKQMKETSATVEDRTAGVPEYSGPREQHSGRERARPNLACTSKT